MGIESVSKRQENPLFLKQIFSPFPFITPFPNAFYPSFQCPFYFHFLYPVYPFSDTLFTPVSHYLFTTISYTLFTPVSNTLFTPILFLPLLGQLLPLPLFSVVHSCTVLCSQRQNTTQQRLTRMYFSPLVSGHQSSCWLWSTFYPLTLANSIFVIITKRVLQCAHVRDSTYRSSL